MLRPLISVGLCAFLCPAMAAERVFDFGKEKLGGPPTGFRSVVGGSGLPGDWRVILDETPSLAASVSPKPPVANKRPVLAQLARDRTEEHYPLLIFDGEVFGDFTLTTLFKNVEGEVEQMAGIAFHIRDEKNYYYIRASSLGTNLSFFKMVNGELTARVGSTVEIPKGVWHELTVECRGNQIRSRLDGKELILVTLPLGANPFPSGKMGFWTKSDSVCYFADTRIMYTPKETFAEVLVREAWSKYPRLQGLKVFAPGPRQAEPKIIASLDPTEIGQPAQKEEQEVITHSVIHYGKAKDRVRVTMPLHDSNGDTIAAVQIVMKSFPGQTEQNAIVRALPIVKQMEARLTSGKDLVQ